MKKILATFLYFLFILISCKKAEVNDGRVRDYREKFYGSYNCLVITNSWSMPQPLADKDTLITVVKVSKFEGFTTVAGKNYKDIEHKVGILVKDSFDPSVHYGNCDGATFYYDEFLHPTITLDGMLTYPEYGCSSHQYFNGKFKNDSIYVSCIYAHMSYTWSQTIIGYKIK